VDQLKIAFFSLLLAGCIEAGAPWYYVEPEASLAAEPELSDPSEEIVPEIAPEVMDIFLAHSCLNCHSSTLALSELDLSTMEGLLKGGAIAGPSLTPCYPELSPLVQVLSTGIDEADRQVGLMPLGGDALPEEVQGVVWDWIASGAGLQVCEPDAPLSEETPEDWIPDFDTDIAPLLEDFVCMNCHGPGAGSSGLEVSSVDGLLRGGVKAGPALIPCDSEASPLLQVVLGGWSDGASTVGVMPPFGDLMSSEDVDLLRRWIDSGAGVESCD